MTARLPATAPFPSLLAFVVVGMLASPLRAPAASAAPRARAPSACFPEPPAAGPGVADPFRPPDPQATALNAAGKTLYRQGKWDEARASYRAATEADRDFGAPTLNVACSFVRQERFTEATQEVLKLLQRGHVPWAREILEATDLGALKVRPEMSTVRAAMAESARRWGEGLSGDLLFVGRLRAPLRVPDAGAGVFILGPQQELFAWSAASGRYRQLTAEDGRVLAFVASKDARQVLYVVAGKLVRLAEGAHRLRGVSLRLLDLPAMSLGPVLAVPGDVTRLELRAADREFLVSVAGDDGDHVFAAAPGAQTLRPAPSRGRPRIAPDVTLTPTSVTGRREQRRGGDCPFTAREKAGEGEAKVIEIAAPGRKPFLLKPRRGAGLAGLATP